MPLVAERDLDVPPVRDCPEIELDLESVLINGLQKAAAELVIPLHRPPMMA